MVRSASTRRELGILLAMIHGGSARCWRRASHEGLTGNWSTCALALRSTRTVPGPLKPHPCARGRRISSEPRCSSSWSKGHPLGFRPKALGRLFPDRSHGATHHLARAAIQLESIRKRGHYLQHPAGVCQPRGISHSRGYVARCRLRALTRRGIGRWALWPGATVQST
ncbi:hypothetical protein GQ53DRAFT_132900 [Thozetella sp. PMI_491]|nr:hypothetical protein GQ53DRAFT_132900 [Thozetella sp. PMI_491]